MALTVEQIAEVERRLGIPQACRVIAYHMKIPLVRVLEVRRKLRAGRPPDILGEDENAAARPFAQTRASVGTSN